jgi:hypothetical protein
MFCLTSQQIVELLKLNFLHRALAYKNAANIVDKHQDASFSLSIMNSELVIGLKRTQLNVQKDSALQAQEIFISLLIP